MDRKLNIEYQMFEVENIIKNINDKVLFDNCYEFEINSSIYHRYIKRHLFFITIQLNENFTYDQYTLKRQRSTFEALDGFYRWFSAQFINRPGDNNSKLQPFLQLYLDDAGSRIDDQMRPITVPHMHGTLLLHPKTMAGFDAFLQNQFLESLIHKNPIERANLFQIGHTNLVIKPNGFYPIEQMEISRFDPEKGSLSNLASYITKFARNDRFVHGHGEQFEIYRKYPHDGSKYPFYKL